MRRSIAVVISVAFCATAAAQSAATEEGASKAQLDKAKQEIVKSTTETQTKQKSGAGYHGARPTSEAEELTNEEKQQVMSRVAKSAKDNYRPITVPPTASADKNAAKATRATMRDPEVQEAIQRNQR